MPKTIIAPTIAPAAAAAAPAPAAAPAERATIIASLTRAEVESALLRLSEEALLSDGGRVVQRHNIAATQGKNQWRATVANLEPVVAALRTECKDSALSEDARKAAKATLERIQRNAKLRAILLG